MILRDVINRVIQIAGLESEVSVDTPGAKLNKLIDCANMIYSELTLEYVHLKTKEDILFENGRAYYGSFSKNVREVLAVRQNGVKKPFTMYPLYVEADIEGAGEVTYHYYLGELSLIDELTLPPQFNEYVVATGVASEYFYRTGLVDEAVFYKNRYDNAVTNLSRRLKSVNLPKRRFV